MHHLVETWTAPNPGTRCHSTWEVLSWHRDIAGVTHTPAGASESLEHDAPPCRDMGGSKSRDTLPQYLGSVELVPGHRGSDAHARGSWVAAVCWDPQRPWGETAWVPDSWAGFRWVPLGSGVGGGRGTSLDHVATSRTLPRSQKTIRNHHISV